MSSVRHSKKGQIISLFFLALGVGFLVQINMPLISYKLWELKFAQDKTILVSPQSDNQVLGISIENTPENFPAFVSTIQRESKPFYSTFTLDVPSLKIKDAKVTVDSNDLNNSLAHLPGTALPGEKGNVFISGHSALPLLFKGNKDYGSIFANLPKMKKGELIVLNSNSGKVTYKIKEIKIVDPKDTSVIMPPDSQGRYVTLMTCVPPGFNTKRLVVLAQSI